MNKVNLKLRVQQLKAMHNFVCSANDENLYMWWIEYYVPDCPSEEDFISIAEDYYEETVKAFQKLVKNEDCYY